MGQKAGSLLKSNAPSPGLPVCLADSCLSDCEYASSDLTVFCFLAVWTPLCLRPAAGSCFRDKFLASTAAKCLFEFSWVGFIYLIYLPHTPVSFSFGFFSLSPLFLTH